jgi:Sulfotransferase family
MDAHAQPTGSKRVPDFFIVGHPKCGTTALWDMLKGHPQIYAPPNKEPYFLADELHPPAATPRSFGWTPETLDQYLALFAPALPEQRTGEASAPYLWSRTAAQHIAEVQPAARIVAILREPSSFLHSLHLQFVQIYIEPERDMRTALALEDSRREGRNLPEHAFWGPQGTLYSDYVRYVEQLMRYQALFSPEQMLVLVYDDYRKDNHATVRRVQRFLGVEDTHPLSVRESNPTVTVRSQRLHSLIHTVASGDGPLPRAVQGVAKTVGPRLISRSRAVAIRNRMLFTAPTAPDRQLMLELRRRFKPEVIALSEHLGRDLVTLWGYDDLG